MSDDPAAFREKTQRMIEANKIHLDRLGRSYVLHLAAALIDTTPGPNLQLPDTEYQATGQLRDSWSWGTIPQNVAYRWNDGGKYDDYGARAMGEIEAAVAGALHMPAVSYLQNDTAYGFIVHEGGGRMPEARPWVTIVGNESEKYAAAARAEVTNGA